MPKQVFELLDYFGPLAAAILFTSGAYIFSVFIGGLPASEKFLTRSKYDRGVNTCPPKGRLFQVEYAIETAKLEATSIGIRTSAGVVLAAEKRATSSLLVSDSMNKIFKVDDHIATTFAGLIADSRTLVNHARDKAQNFWFTYNSKIRVEDVTQSVANIALHFGDDDSKIRMRRPFGVALLFGGVDKTGPRLFHLDPSGTFIDCAAKSIGAASDGAEQQLKDNYQDNMTILEAEKLALSILKQVMEEKLNSSNVEIVVLSPAENSQAVFHRLTPSELGPLIADL